MKVQIWFKLWIKGVLNIKNQKSTFSAKVQDKIDRIRAVFYFLRCSSKSQKQSNCSKVRPQTFQFGCLLNRSKARYIVNVLNRLIFVFSPVENPSMIFNKQWVMEILNTVKYVLTVVQFKILIRVFIKICNWRIYIIICLIAEPIWSWDTARRYWSTARRNRTWCLQPTAGNEWLFWTWISRPRWRVYRWSSVRLYLWWWS